MYLRKFNNTLLFVCIISFLFNIPTSAQLAVNPNQTAAVLSSKLTGPGITISSPVLTCTGVANGIFHSVSTPITIDSGILLTTGQAIQAIGAESFLASSSLGSPGDPSLAALAMATTYDACALEFDFIPNGDTVSFNYQFGSEEYNHSTCGPYNDAFAFFISGPGIVGTQDMALVPGTNIPVTVNSVNGGVPGPGYTLANCTVMGPGSPFSAYYYDNTGGTKVTYKGYTVKMKAFHEVTPCATYHLKMAICDAGNRLYDSGVFIEAGSLKTNSFSFDHIDSLGTTLAGVPHTIVRGCNPAKIKVESTIPVGSDKTLHFTFGGTAVQGIDFTAPDSATIVSGTDSVYFTVTALSGIPTGSKTLEIYLTSPYSCGIVDSIDVNIMDSPSAKILTPDTTICLGESFQIRATGTPGLSYSWSPALGLSSASVMQPIAAPSVTTTYFMTATLPNSGCPALSGKITVTLTNIGAAILTPDTVICPGSSVDIQTSGNPSFTYHWLPGTGINNPNAQDPIVTPSTTTTYSLTVTSATCIYLALITVTVLAPDATILTPDTTICISDSLQIRVTGNPGQSYQWSPGSGLDNPNIMQPIASPVVATTYTLTASVLTPGGAVCSETKKVSVAVALPPPADAGPDQNVCLGVPIVLNAAPHGDKYGYNWAGPDSFASTVAKVTINKSTPASQGIYTVTVVDLNSGCSAQDTTMVKVYNSSVAISNVTLNQTIPYGSSIQLNADSAQYYLWTPDDGSLNNANINNPVATPLVPTTYTVFGIDNHGCRDSASVSINLDYDHYFIPNAFTPNGDGLNDYFKVFNLGLYRLVEMRIYNRWGNEIYYLTDGGNKGWDGTFNGVPQDIGTYCYTMIISAPNGELTSHKGNFMLIR
jgi:gliding motility-associated-like protein